MIKKPGTIRDKSVLFGFRSAIFSPRMIKICHRNACLVPLHEGLLAEGNVDMIRWRSFSPSWQEGAGMVDTGYLELSEVPVSQR